MRRSPLTVSASLSLGLREGGVAGRRRIELLQRIGETGSITRAARAAGLSYKAAWDAVDQMNNLADRPLVERVAGGRGGGGTRLTARGEQLVETFRAVEAEHAQLLTRLNRRVAAAGRDAGVLGRLLMLTSARNQFAGKVVRIKTGAVNDEVELQLPGGERIVAIVTHHSVEALGLRRGSEAVALVKASWIIVGVGDGRSMKLSARNQLEGTVRTLTRGAVNTEVAIELKGGGTVVAVITNASARALKLAKGRPAQALFKASSVILGVVA